MHLAAKKIRHIYIGIKDCGACHKVLKKQIHKNNKAYPNALFLLLKISIIELIRTDIIKHPQKSSEKIDRSSPCSPTLIFKTPPPVKLKFCEIFDNNSKDVLPDEELSLFIIVKVKDNSSKLAITTANKPANILIANNELNIFLKNSQTNPIPSKADMVVKECAHITKIIEIHIMEILYLECGIKLLFKKIINAGTIINPKT